LLKKIVVLLSVILFSSIIIPTDAKSNNDIQGESFAIKNPNPDVLYDWYVSGGGVEGDIGDFYWGFCKVWVESVATKSYYGGNSRNNPDGTFYPGDGFGYGFAYGWAGDPSKCRNLTVCPIISNNIAPGSSKPCELQKLKILSKKAAKDGKLWLASSIAEISEDENSSNHYISLQINAERWGCYHPKKAPLVCGWGTISATGSFAPPVIKPVVELSIFQEHINDMDGFKSGNLDHTYYVFDAINLVHNPQYKWKKERAGTLSVKITKQHDLKLEEQFQCEMIQCTFTLNHHGFEPWPRQYEYGMGVTLYNATRDEDIKKHVLVYKIELFNLGKLIHSVENKTEQLVVVYDPIYYNYPYLVLQDEYWWSWGNRHAVALQYDGSRGGGPDDTAGIHQNRRSKINSYEYSGYAFDPILPKKMSQELSWEQADPISLAQKCSDVEVDSTSFEVKGKTAMFVKSGFGKVWFFWPVAKQMLEKRYANATIQNMLQSSGFAGFETKNLTAYSYQYPDVKFNNPVKILTYRSDGSRTDLPIFVKLVPDFAKGAQYTQEYACDKVLHDTDSPEIANIVVDDMYEKENQANGTGYINMKTQLTSTWFAPFYSVIVNDTRELPIAEGYKALSPYEITITVGEKTRTTHRMINFLSPFVHVVNLDSDNLLNVTQSFGFVRINPDERFGEIIKVLINRKELSSDCTNGCTTTINSNQDLDIEAWNEWGGHATAHLKKTDEMKPNYEINWNLAFVAIMVASAGLLLWKFLGQVLEHLGFRRV
jgi:hypothetical protein